MKNMGETVGSIMATTVPTCFAGQTKTDILNIFLGKKWASVHNVYVLDEHKRLLGIVYIDSLLAAESKTTAKDLMVSVRESLRKHDDKEKAIYLAIKDDIIAIPVVDEHEVFVGAVTAHGLVDVMHNEHIEDTLLTAGIRGTPAHIAQLATERTALIVRSRAPWLVFGLTVGLGLGLISSLFEDALAANVAIAFFIPVVAYIADSVGTQSEAIAVRALATLKINPGLYLSKELLVGVMLGSLMGILGGLGAWAISQQATIGLAVGLSLFVASIIAATLAAAIPMIFKAMGKDPALGSGPLATALQDVIS
ncbi:MAG TPA: magnesium transporter, partial [Candidatus Saccharimonadales bacterium]|nr:magnesium transporter [Candidatus Saccharimonadales bacterium]